MFLCCQTRNINPAKLTAFTVSNDEVINVFISPFIQIGLMSLCKIKEASPPKKKKHKNKNKEKRTKLRHRK